MGPPLFPQDSLSRFSTLEPFSHTVMPMLKLAFHGGAREVTGSCYRISTPHGQLLLDCGMVQGGPERHDRNRRPFPFSPSDLGAVLLSHAHIDHSGRLPLLVSRGYEGPIWATEPTAELSRIMLSDAGRIQEEDAAWKIKRLRKQRRDYSWVRPLYTEKEALAAAEKIRGVPFHQEVPLGDLGTCLFHKAGHILGAAIVEVRVPVFGETRKILFSGDLGIHDARLMGSPEPVEAPDYLLLESTYGDRLRPAEGDLTEHLRTIVQRAADRGGKVIVPAFAVGRTQEVMARLNDLVESGRLSGVPVYVDSPMAAEAIRVFERHSEGYSDEAQRLLREGDEPLAFPGLRVVSSREESMALNELKGPAVILSASGMCTAGRIKHHLRHNLADPRNTVLFVGYQARNTLGRLIQEGVSPVRIFGEWHPVHAEIVSLESFSAHADREELAAWYRSLGQVRRGTFLVHGEESASLALAEKLMGVAREPVVVPRLDEEYQLS